MITCVCVGGMLVATVMYARVLRPVACLDCSLATTEPAIPEEEEKEEEEEEEEGDWGDGKKEND